MPPVDDREGAASPEGRDQPGLEVVPREQQQRHAALAESSGLQVAENPYGYYHDGKVPVSEYRESHKIPVEAGYSELPQSGQKQQTPPTQKRRKWLWFAIGGAALLLVVIGAVVGGVLGSRASKSSQTESSGASGGATPTSDGPSSTATPTPDVNTTTKLQSIRQGSPLTVAGWGKSGGVEVLLFYQDSDNQIRRSRYDNTASSASDNASWTTPIKYTSFATAGSRLGVTIIQYSNGYMPQTELFYSGDGNRLLGVSINDNLTPSYGEDSVKSMDLSTAVNSSVSAYWPWVTYQDPDGSLVEVRNRLLGAWSPAAEWDAKKLGVVALAASRLALVPLSANFTKMAVKGGYGIFYQATSKRLVPVVPDLKSDQLAKDYAPSWPTDFPSITLADRGVFAAFSVARPSDSLQRVNTYLLYLDDSSNINVVSTTDSSTWTTSQPSVLKDVDSDTDISCLTMATTYRDSTQSEVLLKAASTSSTTRCYFQRAGLVREVVFDGTEWTDNGNVPIP